MIAPAQKMNKKIFIAHNGRAWLVGGELAVPPMHNELKMP